MVELEQKSHTIVCFVVWFDGVSSFGLWACSSHCRPFLAKVCSYYVNMDMNSKSITALKDLSSSREEDYGHNHNDKQILALNKCHMLYKQLIRPASLRNSTMVMSRWLIISSSVSPGRLVGDFTEVSILKAFSHGMLLGVISICVKITAFVPHCPTFHFIGLCQLGMTNLLNANLPLVWWWGYGWLEVVEIVEK